jgi:hypothetical protein
MRQHRRGLIVPLASLSVLLRWFLDLVRQSFTPGNYFTKILFEPGRRRFRLELSGACRRCAVVGGEVTLWVTTLKSPESGQRPSSVPFCNLMADQCYGHSNEEATSQIAPQSPPENSKIRISAVPGVSFASAATGHLSGRYGRSLRLRVFTQFPPARSSSSSLLHHARRKSLTKPPSVIRPSWRQKSAPATIDVAMATSMTRCLSRNDLSKQFSHDRNLGGRRWGSVSADASSGSPCSESCKLREDVVSYLIPVAPPDRFPIGSGGDALSGKRLGVELYSHPQ